MNANELSDTMDQETSRWQDKAQALKERAQGLGLKAKDKVTNASQTADLYVREYAWTSMAVVAVAACFVGFMLGRRQS